MTDNAGPQPGWYPDSAGQEWRYWDGRRWAAPPRPPRRRGPWVVVAVGAVVLLLCGVVVWLGLGSLRGPGRSDLRTAADRIVVPADFTLVDEYWIGSQICLDDCLHLDRTYSSPSDKPETYRTLSAALQRAGYRCATGCEGSAGSTTTWKGTDGRRLKLTVSSFDDPADEQVPERTRLDPNRAVYAYIEVT